LIFQMVRMDDIRFPWHCQIKLARPRKPDEKIDPK